VIFTSNLGVREAINTTDDVEEQRSIILTVVKERLRPEFYNRISQVVLFNALTHTQLERIVTMQLSQVAQKLADERSITMVMTPAAANYLADRSYDPTYGARPVGRTLQQLVLSPLAAALLGGDVRPGGTLCVDFTAGELTISAEASTAAIG
jgi:ATP-dependent Clp protease ATP-binding subunit ClpB